MLMLLRPLEETGSSEKMIIDFKDLKLFVENEIVSKFDHAFVADCTNKEEKVIGRLLESMGKKVFWFTGRTTAENMSKWIYEKLSTQLNVDKVKLWETPTSCAVYSEGGV